MNNVYIKLFISFFKAGLFTIGGGLAMLPLIHRYIVEKEKFITAEEMVDGIAVAQSLPGVVAINVATYVGKKTAGMKGAAAATIGTVMPSYLIIVAIAAFLGSVDDNVFVEGALMGIKAAAAGLILVAGVKLGKMVLKGPFTWIMAAAAFILIIFFGARVVYVILAAAAIGIIYNLIATSREVKS